MYTVFQAGRTLEYFFPKKLSPYPGLYYKCSIEYIFKSSRSESVLPALKFYVSIQAIQNDTHLMDI